MIEYKKEGRARNDEDAIEYLEKEHPVYSVSQSTRGKNVLTIEKHSQRN